MSVFLVVCEVMDRSKSKRYPAVLPRSDPDPKLLDSINLMEGRGSFFKCSITVK